MPLNHRPTPDLEQAINRHPLLVAQEALNYRIQFEELITSISTHFINLNCNEIDNGINQALQLIGEFAGVERSYVFLFSADGTQMENTHEWCASGIEPQIDNLKGIPAESLPWWLEQLNQCETIHLPPEASAEKEILRSQDNESLVVPIACGRFLMGFLGFDSVREEKAWEHDNIALLTLVGEIFANALERQRSEKALLRSAQTNQALLKAIPDLIFRISRNGTFLEYEAVNHSDLLLPPNQFLGKNLDEVLPIEVAQPVMDCVQQVLQTGETQTLEYKLPLNGEVHDYEARIVVSGEDEVLVIVRDITERKQSQEALAKREQYLAALVEVQRRLLAFDGDGKCYTEILELLGQVSGASRIYVFENHKDEAANLLMSQRAEWCAEGIHPKIDNPTLQNLSYDDFLPRWAQTLAQGEIIAGIVADFPESERLILPQGILSILILPLTVNNEFFGFIGFDHCVEARVWEASEVALLQAAAAAIAVAQERQQAEDALRESEQKYRSVINNIQEVIFQMDATGLWTFLNPAWTEITGFTVEQSLGTSFLNYVHPDDRQRNLELFQPLIARQKEYARHEIRYLTKDGGFRWIEVFARLTLDANGTIIGTSGTLNDITQHKQAEDAVRESEEKFRNLVEQTNDWVWEIDSKNIFMYVNPRVREIVGYEPKEIIGKTIFDFMSLDEAKRFATILNFYIPQREPFINLETTLIQKDGHLVILEMSGSPVFDAQGILQGYRGISRDITERKQVEHEIRKALTKEKELNDLKSRFVSITSHEFRTPLSIISSSAGLLQDYGHKLDAEKKLKHLHRIQSSVRHMTQLLEDVLLINKAEAEKLEFNPEPLDLVKFCRDLVEELQLSIVSNHRIVLQTRGANSLSNAANYINACMDKKILRQVLTNLLSNAVKYSPHSSTVYFELACQDGEAVFEIRDEGIGITPEDQEKLFESFYRGKNVGNIPGTGLGLSIVKKCVNLHKGKITVASTPGVGTTLKVYLPLN